MDAIHRDNNDGGVASTLRRYRGALALQLPVTSACALETRRLVQQFQEIHSEDTETIAAITAVPMDEWHITLLPKYELQQLGADRERIEQEAIHQLTGTRVFPIAVGGNRARGVFFVVCLWPRAQAFRMRLGLPVKAFHITLSIRDDHTIDKTFTSILITNSTEEEEPTSSGSDSSCCLDQLPKQAMEALCRQLLLDGAGHEMIALHAATQLCLRFHEGTPRGWARLADAALAQGSTKLAMLAYARALAYCLRNRSNDTRAEDCSRDAEAGQSDAWRRKLSAYCSTQLVRSCSTTTEWGLLFLDSEFEQQLAPLPRPVLTHLLRPWPRNVRQEIERTARSLGGYATTTQLELAPRERLQTLGLGPFHDHHHHHQGEGRSKPIATPPRTRLPSLYHLPRFFRWVVPFVLAGMSTPRHAVDVTHLVQAVGIRHLVTLTKEEPVPLEWVQPHAAVLRHTFLPMVNYRAPSMEQIDLFLSHCIESAANEEPVLVHCGGGKGRAGTLLACYLVAFGFQRPDLPADAHREGPTMSASEAIFALRALRPGSVETEEQEHAVAAYSSRIWQRGTRHPPPPVVEPPPSQPEIEGNQDVALSDLLVLCGLPGSGKTSFRSALLKRSLAAIASGGNNDRHRLGPSTGMDWIVLSGDEHGRQACERGLATSTQGVPPRRRVILDRCNALASDRATFLALAATWSTHATAIWFDLPATVCVARAQRRSDHRTLPPGPRVRAAVAQHGRQFSAPRLHEGFSSVVRVTSTQAAMALVRQLTPPLPLLKFPRTPHLLDLGAATADDLVLTSASLRPSPLVAADGGGESESESKTHQREEEEVVITEKLDGANLGISLDASGFGFVVQNRSHTVTSGSHAQFQKLDAFLVRYGEALRRVLRRDVLCPERWILYGEWLAATHSIAYTALRSHFYAFDLYDRVEKRFLPRREMKDRLSAGDDDGGDGRDDGRVVIRMVPELWRGPASQLPHTDELVRLTQQRSAFYDGPVEGIYLKWERLRDRSVRERAKIVRGDFLAGNEHWSRGAIQWNGIREPISCK